MTTATELVSKEAPKKVSRVGKRAIAIPRGVTVTIADRRVEIKGPKGTMSRELAPSTSVEKEGETLKVTSSAAGRDASRLQGLERALLANMVRGVVEGYERSLELVGTGYRCEIKGRTVTFQLGFSHQKFIDLPASVTANVPPDSKGTMLDRGNYPRISSPGALRRQGHSLSWRENPQEGRQGWQGPQVILRCKGIFRNG